MEVQIRKNRTVRLVDQENVHAVKGKRNVALPAKKPGLAVRGALGDINTNVQIQQRVNNVGKVAFAKEEIEKKVALNRLANNYNHVQSKIDTGRSVKAPIQSMSKPPLRREESTAALANRAIACTRAALKEKSAETSETVNKKVEKKVTKLSVIKENKEPKALKPILKEPTESLGKLKLAEERPAIIDHVKLQKLTTHAWEDLNASLELPDDVEDIDERDKGSPLLLPIYINDIYTYLKQLELKYPIDQGYLMKQTEISGKMRGTLIDWLVEVHRQFTLLPETFHLTVGIIDRYLQAVPSINRNRLQLVGVTAMFIASKYEEIYAPDIGDFVYVTDKAYCKKDIIKCERDMLCKLDFCLARPIPLHFLRRFIKAAHGVSTNHHLAKYLVDLSLVEYSMAHFRPSELAAAAICLSLHLLSTKTLDAVWTPTMIFYSGYSLEHILPIIRKLAKIVVNVSNSKNQAVYNKYTEASLAKVACLPQLRGDAIFSLIS